MKLTVAFGGDIEKIACTECGDVSSKRRHNDIRNVILNCRLHVARHVQTGDNRRVVGISGFTLLDPGKTFLICIGRCDGVPVLRFTGIRPTLHTVCDFRFNCGVMTGGTMLRRRTSQDGDTTQGDENYRTLHAAPRSELVCSRVCSMEPTQATAIGAGD